jgi:hypothetical protein
VSPLRDDDADDDGDVAVDDVDEEAVAAATAAAASYGDADGSAGVYRHRSAYRYPRVDAALPVDVAADTVSPPATPELVARPRPPNTYTAIGRCSDDDCVSNTSFVSVDTPPATNVVTDVPCPNRAGSRVPIVPGSFTVLVPLSHVHSTAVDEHYVMCGEKWFDNGEWILDCA